MPDSEPKPEELAKLRRDAEAIFEGEEKARVLADLDELERLQRVHEEYLTRQSQPWWRQLTFLPGGPPRTVPRSKILLMTPVPLLTGLVVALVVIPGEIESGVIRASRSTFTAATDPVAFWTIVSVEVAFVLMCAFMTLACVMLLFRKSGVPLKPVEVDPLAEANAYASYGRDKQAIEVLKEAVKRNPERPELALRLYELEAKASRGKASPSASGRRG